MKSILPFILPLLLLFLLTHKGIAQVQLFTQKELTTEHIYRVTQDYDGFIWVISDKGLFKYDGIDIKIFTTKDGLPSNDITNIRVTEDNKVWFLNTKNNQGFIYKDVVYSFPHEKKENRFFSDSRIIQLKDNLKVFDSNGDLTILKDGKWRVIENTTKIEQQKNFIDNKYCVNFFIENDSVFITKTNGEVAFLHEDSKVLLFDLYPGDILFLYFFNKIVAVELKNINTHTIDLEKYNLDYHDLIRIHYVNKSIQITGKNFLAKINPDFTLEIIPSRIEKSKNNYSMIDAMNNTWFVSFQNGVYFYPFTEKMTKSYSQNESITSLHIFNDRVYYVDNKKQLNYIENGIVKNITNLQQLYDVSVIDTAMYLFSSSVNSIDKKNNIRTEKEKFGNIKYFFKIKNRRFICQSSLFNEVDSNFNIINQYKNQVKAVTLYKDTIFIGTYKGLFFLDENTIKKHLTNFEKPITSLNTTMDKLIIGTDGFGVYEYQKGKINKDIKNNLIIESINVYKDSILLVATNNGAYQIKITENELVLEYIYTINDGLKSNFVNDILVFNDSLYFGTNNGLTVLKYGTRNNQIQALYLKDIKWNNKKVYDTIINVLHTENNTLEINYSVIYYALENNLKYSYKLIPIMDDFIEISKGKINLNNLDVGEYSLVYKIEDINKNTLEKSIHIIIRPNWYQTKTFFALIVLLFAFFLYYGFIRYKKRINKQANKKIERQNQISNFKLQALRSQMNPHFVFNSLNAIQYYISDNQTELSEEYLVKFSKLIRQFFDLSNVQTISLEKEIELLRNYLDLEKMRFENKLNYTITITNDLNKKNTEIPTMILQPIIENAINHGVFHKESDGEVKVEFNYLGEKVYQVKIIDDGIGIDKALEIKKNSIKSHQSRSTHIFKERIELLNRTGKWKIDYRIFNTFPEKNDPGTTVVLIISKL